MKEIIDETSMKKKNHIYCIKNRKKILAIVTDCIYTYYINN